MENVLIIGGARSGIAPRGLLRAHGCAVTLTDSREVKEKHELRAWACASQTADIRTGCCMRTGLMW